MTALLEVRNATKVFGGGRLFRKKAGAVALDNFSLKVETDPPSITAIVGESGSGKTTLARLLLGVEHHLVDGVSVPIFGVAKTVADLFRYRQTVGVSVALEGLREALRKKKASPSEIAKEAADAKVWKVMEPYMSALTSHG